MEIVNESTRLSPEQFEELKKKLEEKPNEVITDIKLRVGETDVRHITEQDKWQIQYRFMNDQLNAYNVMIQTLLDMNIILIESLPVHKKKEVLEKLDGIKKGKVNK